MDEENMTEEMRQEIVRNTTAKMVLVQNWNKLNVNQKLDMLLDLSVTNDDNIQKTKHVINNMEIAIEKLYKLKDEIVSTVNSQGQAILCLKNGVDESLEIMKEMKKEIDEML